MAKKLTMAQKRALVTNRKKATDQSFHEKVHVTASFKRSDDFNFVVYGSEGSFPFPGQNTSEVENYKAVNCIRPDSFGNLIAEAYCGDTAFVCTKDELPQLISFLQKLLPQE